MSSDPVRRANLAAIECERRPQLPDSFRRADTRLGAALGSTRTGLSVVVNKGDSPARVAMFSSSGAAVGAVVYPDSDLVWMWTADDSVDMIVERGSAVADIAPWTPKG